MARDIITSILVVLIAVVAFGTLGLAFGLAPIQAVVLAGLAGILAVVAVRRRWRQRGTSV